MSYLYLASPYSCTDENATSVQKAGTQRYRYYKAVEATALLLKSGQAVYSPIVHCHELALAHDLPTDANFWFWYNKTMLVPASSFGVLMLEGWKDSTGVNKETKWAEELEMVTRYFEFSNGGDHLIERAHPR